MAPPSPETSLEKRRWLVISICLHIVVIPRIRGIIAKKIKSLYDLKRRTHHIHTQTKSKYLDKLYEGAWKCLNYGSINGNDPKYPERFDYRVQNAVSFAKLLVQPFMAKFIGFDDSFDASAALAVLFYEGLFKPNVAKSAKKVNDCVRTECAHPNFTKWTQKHYSDYFGLLKELVSHISVEFPDWTDKEHIRRRLQWWEKYGTDFCLGSLDVPDFLRDSLQEVKAFSTAFADLKGTLSKEVQLQISEALEEIRERRDGQDNISGRLSTLESEIEVLKKTVLEMQMKLKEKKDVEIENEVLKRIVLEMQTKLEEKKDVENENEVLKKTVLEIQMKLKENEVLEVQTQFETLGTNNATFGEQEQIQDSV